jgi:hypothetical protein
MAARERPGADGHRDHREPQGHRDPDDPPPRLVAAQLVALTRAVSSEFLRRRLAGESLEAIFPLVRAAAARAFDLLESGVGDYAVKQR